MSVELYAPCNCEAAWQLQQTTIGQTDRVQRRIAVQQRHGGSAVAVWLSRGGRVRRGERAAVNRGRARWGMGLVDSVIVTVSLPSGSRI